ncbi:hypothetical protein ACHAXS_010989 [Conticribra weissflogii]
MNTTRTSLIAFLMIQTSSTAAAQTDPQSIHLRASSIRSPKQEHSNKVSHWLPSFLFGNYDEAMKKMGRTNNDDAGSEDVASLGNSDVKGALDSGAKANQIMNVISHMIYFDDNIQKCCGNDDTQLPKQRLSNSITKTSIGMQSCLSECMSQAEACNADCSFDLDCKAVCQNQYTECTSECIW